MNSVVLVLLFLATSVSAQHKLRVEDIDMPVASPYVISMIFAVFAIIFICIVITVMYQDKQKKRNLEQHSDHQFLRQCERFGLGANEVFSLRNYLKHCNITSYPSVFNSVSIFEEAVEKECAEIRHKWGIGTRSESATLVIQTVRRKLGYDRIIMEMPMSSTRNIDLGQHMDLLPPLGAVGQISGALVTQKTELTFTVKYMSEKAGFEPGKFSELTASYTRLGDGVYTIPLKIIAVDSGANTITFVHTNQFNRQQFRDFVRMVVDLPLQCRLLHRERATKSTPLGALLSNTMILDISGGGIAFIADEELRKEDRLSLSFLLGDRKFILKGEVIGVVKKERRGQFRFKHHVEFKDIARADSDAIVRYIFEKQREQLQVNVRES